MKLKSLLHRVALSVSLPLAGLSIMTSCGSIREDLPQCRLWVEFKYDYNMLSADAFAAQVDRVELFVFDSEGVFLFSQTGQGAPLAVGGYRMEVQVPAGEYRFMAWAGAHDSYEIAALTPGSSTIEEMRLKLIRDTSLIVDHELEPLWYGEITDVDFTGREHLTATVNLIKNTNKVRFLFQGQTPAWEIDMDDYTYEILESNGLLAYDNSLLPDDSLSYRPYYIEQLNPSAVVMELNTMRLMADRATRFVVTEIETGDRVLDIDLINFLTMLRMEAHSGWSNQEFLDREDEYAVVFFFSRSWLVAQISINDWTWYIQNEEGE